MRIVKCGYRYRHSKNFMINRPTGSGDYIFLILQSPAYFILNGKRVETKGCSVIFYKKGTPQIYGALNEEFVNDWIHFELDEGEYEWMRSKGVVFDEIIDLVSSEPLSLMIRKMCSEMSSKNRHARESSELYLRLIALKLCDCTQKGEGAKTQALFYDKLLSVREEIYLNPQYAWKISDVAEKLSISESYLQHLYKSYFQTNIKKDIILSRIAYSKHLLFSTDSTVSAVSYACGFENDVHFMRTFKKLVGVTPSEYRKKSSQE